MGNTCDKVSMKTTSSTERQRASLEELWMSRKNNQLYNTSYPLSPDDWKKYRRAGELDFSGVRQLAFYIHIPFCRHLCPFCEYKRTTTPSKEIQQRYLSGLETDVKAFIDKYPDVELSGFDIGGGTPTALSTANFGRLMDLYKHTVQRLHLSAQYEPSIEGTFQTLTTEKTRMITAAGFRRVSLGIQSANKLVQQSNGRINPDSAFMLQTINTLRTEGVEKINIDLMYGLKGQDLPHLQNDLDLIEILSPEHVTLYEFRPNLLGVNENMSKEELYRSYNFLYKGLTALGYNSRFGQNTFSKNSTDKGLSSYLRNRMFHFMPYKGFGIAAQSMSPQGISYNIGKEGNRLDTELLLSNTFPAADCYLLPRHELLSKYLAVSAYGGFISFEVANRILKDDFGKVFDAEICFCLDRGLMDRHKDRLRITPEGFKHYGATFSLFYKTTEQ